ncbi:uncharacterized protein LOC115886027 [Sitophilus oryzae]|uniref:Uncharacterized protein LOC115886027 n=1 Tax=Sitophilus oryzae TaxID=7048 RepID=A0A6J2YBS8_SITOR|nr:uncharacterized protein LOC115886027 [Sitophilus oryzae]
MVFMTNPHLCIQECHCSCEVGLSQSCHHLLGLAFYLQDIILRGEYNIPEHIASTSQAMLWNKPRGTKVIPEDTRYLTFQKPTNLLRRKAPVVSKIAIPSTSVMSNEQADDSPTKLQKLKESLQKIDKGIPLSFLISTENTNPEMTIFGQQNRGRDSANDDNMPVDLPILNTTSTNILISCPLPQVNHFHEFSLEEAVQLERCTRVQGDSQIWHEKRKNIFTSSNFGLLCKRQKAIDADFFKKMWEKNLDHLKAIKHGRKEEENAKHLYREKTNHKVYTCGLVIHPYAPHLETSPDGVIVISPTNVGLIEFKCPYNEKVDHLNGRTWEIAALEQGRVDYRYTRLIEYIYSNATTTVKLHETTGKIEVGRGVRQGDTISPKLFTAVLEYAMKSLSWKNRGINIDGEWLTHLRFTDDIVLVSDNIGDSKQMLEELVQASLKVGLRINTSKTQIMTNLVLTQNIRIGDADIKETHIYKYLGHEIQKSERTTKHTRYSAE